MQQKTQIDSVIPASFEEAESSQIRTVSLDLILTLGTLFSLKWFLLQFTAMWTFAGPISLLASLGVATWCLKRNNETWKSIGFKHDTSWLKLSLWVLVALIVTTVLGNLAGGLAGSLIIPGSGVDEQAEAFMAGRFDNVPGNFPVYLYWLVISWVIGAFTEELLFRGFMISRFEKVFSRLPFAIGLAILAQALIFGQQHMYYQGIQGLVAMTVIGIFSGMIYVFCKRRLLPLMISHGLANTVGITMMYLGSTGAG
ncbi:CPBP family intramembrane metalloprotease [Pseudoalteromonas sp. C2R02]|uniref:CPBP family intramembrane glutamic endopeptidase n=1 Tax=Pseudoalteromonas sp. C2R02 TaxID=2841565 RepID=UPI001C08E5C3|nr:CPBP family intramembrane glutamic endopeptidase [Pseudoalteromonas sp. C2R02]MBU2971669.1 CPBP family intramembrane metalloprotease [Pseudoalteromonas sp. C2R02]